MSSNNLIYDECYIKKKNNGNASIFNYMTNTNMFVNKEQCFNNVPPFIGYIQIGTPKQNIDIENELRGSTRLSSKCPELKYTPSSENLVTQVSQI